ncbi:MAG: PIN domain nuclease [Burkholderiales bacterium]|nr:PIN domain nuclease [Burkholderiales bacterium]
MILVDSSVWIDYFGGVASPQTDRLDALLGVEPLVTGDLILAEVLQGFAAEQDFRQVRLLLESFEVVPLAGHDVCVQAADNFRTLRRKGVTIRKTIDTIIATCCIRNGYVLLHDDRDFDAFVEHLGLRVAAPKG